MTPEMHLLLVRTGIWIEPREELPDLLTGKPSGYLESDNDYLRKNAQALVRLLEEGGLERLVGLAIQKEKERIEV